MSLFSSSQTDGHNQIQQPVEDMEMEIAPSYEDSMHGTKYSVAETVEIGSSDKDLFNPNAVKLEEVDSGTSMHIERMISTNEKFMNSPKSTFNPEDQEDYENDMKEIQEAISCEEDKIPVKRMRRLVPKMRMVAYMSEEEIRSKRKHKHLWDDKPEDWECNIPFKDPNNKSGNEGKPGKEVLTKMFRFLKKKILLKNAVPSVVDYKKENYQLQHPSEESVPMVTLAPAQESIIIETTPIQAQHPMEQIQPHQQSQPVQNPPQAEVNDPVSGLYRRIEEKIRQVEVLLAEYQECREALHTVFQDIIKSLYIQSKAVTMCGYFLDAGHDLENLLDKGLAFGKLLDASVIQKGCNLICRKYASTQRTFGSNLQNVETPIFHVKEEVSDEAVARRARALGQSSAPTPFSQTVSDDCYIKQEPLSPGMPASPASDLTNKMRDVKLQGDIDPSLFGINTKRRIPDIFNFVEIRNDEQRTPDVFDPNKFGKESSDTDKCGDILDKLVKSLMDDSGTNDDQMSNNHQNETCDPFSNPMPPPNQEQINQTMKLLSSIQCQQGEVLNDVNLNSAADKLISEDALFDAVLGLEHDFSVTPQQEVMPTPLPTQMPNGNSLVNIGAQQPKVVVAYTCAQASAPPPETSQLNTWQKSHMQGSSSQGLMPCVSTATPVVNLPTTLEDVAESDVEENTKRTGGGKVCTQRRRSVRRTKGKGKGKDKYYNL